MKKKQKLSKDSELLIDPPERQQITQERSNSPPAEALLYDGYMCDVTDLNISSMNLFGEEEDCRNLSIQLNDSERATTSFTASTPNYREAWRLSGVAESTTMRELLNAVTQLITVCENTNQRMKK